MTARSIVTHLIVAGIAFAIGWTLSTGGSSDSSAKSLGAVASEEPVAVMAEILRIPDPAERAVALAGFFESTDPVWAQLLWEALTAEGTELPVDEITETLFASWWAKSDPAAAFAHIVDPGWANRHPWVRSVLREWVRQDPLAAAAAVATLPPDPTRGRLDGARIVLDEWFEQDETVDPTPLLGLIRQLEPLPRAAAIERILTSMIEAHGLDATERFAESVPSEAGAIGVNLKQELMARMGVVLLAHDVERALGWAQKHGDERDGSGIRKHLAYYWALEDGEAAMEWAIALSDDLEKPSIVKRAWLSFGRKKPDEARNWLQARKPDRVLQGIYGRHLTNVARQDAESALALAEKATDAAVRERMLVAVGKGWIQTDPAAAEAWMQRSGLSAESQRRIRELAGPRAAPEAQSG